MDEGKAWEGLELLIRCIGSMALFYSQENGGGFGNLIAKQCHTARYRLYNFSFSDTSSGPEMVFREMNDIFRLKPFFQSS